MLTLTVDIPNGMKEVIEIRATDDIEKIANEFCFKHKLDESAKSMLIYNIRKILFESSKDLNLKNKEPIKKIESKNANKERYIKPKQNHKPYINEYSRKFVNNEDVPVYERLYNRALINMKRKQNEKINLEKEFEPKENKRRNLSLSKDIVDLKYSLLYQRGIVEKNKRHLNSIKGIEEKAQKEMAFATFKPEINQNSKKIVYVLL